MKKFKLMGASLLEKGAAIVGICSMAIVTACSYVTPATEAPFPSDSRIEKSFFFNYDSKGEFVGPKTFACGWSYENVAIESEDVLLGNHAQGDHCNIEFEQTEFGLLGKMVSPSIPDRKDWKVIVRIPINSHFYLEKAKDARGRETNVVTENDKRSHWSARPYMNLEFTGMTWYISGWSGLTTPLTGFGVQDIEVDRKTGFLGFTVSGYHWLAPTIQAKTRVNFLEFKSDPTFDKTPVRHENAKYVNLLHVMGKLSEGVNQVMYAAHWDLREKRDIYLHGFPKEFEKLGRDSVAEWNKVFNKLGVDGDYFNVKISDRKYGFDLRYPTLYWVADRRLSAGGSAPLGIAYNIADVRTGKMLYGGLTIWGGTIDNYINRYTPADSNSSSQQDAIGSGDQPKTQYQFGLMESSASVMKARTAIPEGLLRFQNSSEGQNRLGKILKSNSELVQKIDQYLKTVPTSVTSVNSSDLLKQGLSQAEIQKAIGKSGVISVADLNKFVQASATQLLNSSSDFDRITGMVASDLSVLSSKYESLSRMYPTSQTIFNMDAMQKSLGLPTFAESVSRLPFGLSEVNEVKNMRASKEAIVKSITARMQQQLAMPQNVHDLDRRLSDVGPMVLQKISQLGINKADATRAFVKDIILHELGHMLGLGHNFKENLLPEKTDVALKSQMFGGFDYSTYEKAAKTNYTNYSTVMGYKSGAVDIQMHESQIKPGPMDHMVMTFLYKRMMPVLPVAKTDSDDWKLVKLPEDSLIPKTINVEGKAYRPAFFPACNDIEASISIDPYCNRFDRGYDAVTITKTYLEDYKATLINNLFAFTEVSRNQSYLAIEGALYGQGLRSFGRSRLFYDYMRQKYDPLIKKVMVSNDPKNNNYGFMTSFASTCKDVYEGKTNDTSDLVKMFKENKELTNLCVATGTLMDELTLLLQMKGNDYTKIDYFDRAISGGLFGGDYKGQFTSESYFDYSGRWTSISRFPIKITSLFTLTTSAPYNDFYGFVFPVIRYSSLEGNYHLSTLYPDQYATALASAVESNMNAPESADTDEEAYIGQTLISMGTLLSNAMMSNDSLKFDLPYFKSLSNQTTYDYAYSLVRVKKMGEEGTETASKFTATVSNLNTELSETVPEFYVYKGNRVIMKTPPRTLLYPISPLRWVSNQEGMLFAISMTYADDYQDVLKSNGVKKVLESRYSAAIDSCLVGKSGEGLSNYFSESNTAFKGFKFPAAIHMSNLDLNDYYRSVDEWYGKYYSGAGLKAKPSPATCENALRAQAVIFMSASAINGFFLPDMLNFIQKGVQ